MSPTSLMVLRGEKTLRCPACRQQIKGVWHADCIEGILFRLVSQKGEEAALSRWLEANRPQAETGGG